MSDGEAPQAKDLFSLGHVAQYGHLNLCLLAITMRKCFVTSRKLHNYMFRPSALYLLHLFTSNHKPL